jgi:PHP family Zn ribbon phosphoesterase
VAESIRKFREDIIVMVPGGGGNYGERIIPEDREHMQEIKERRNSEIQCRYKN